MNSQNQSQSQNSNQKVQQQASHSVFFNNQSRVTVDRSEKYTTFQQNKKQD